MLKTAVAPTLHSSSVHQSLEPVFSVFRTRDYNQFKVMGDNRDINTLHVKRLVESFKQKYLVSPIVVNERFEVIDGQHRLLACKETGLPVYFIIMKGYGIDEVQVYNTNQKNWSKMDYLKMYCEKGVKPYLELQKFMDDFPDFGIQASERIVTLTPYAKKHGTIGGKRGHLKHFEEGKLIVPNITKSYQLARKIMDFKPWYPNYHRGTFISAILPLFASKVYDHKEMIYKVEVCAKKNIKIVDSNDVAGYRLILEDIYNWKRHEKKVSFKYE